MILILMMAGSLMIDFQLLHRQLINCCHQLDLYG
jgi:hypothetical protein